MSRGVSVLLGAARSAPSGSASDDRGVSLGDLAPEHSACSALVLRDKSTRGGYSLCK